MAKAIGYIVVYDDDCGMRAVYGADPDCDGALQWSGSPVMFPDRASARRAIRISEAKARLDKAQGAPANDDFLPAARKYVKILPLVAAEGGG